MRSKIVRGTILLAKLNGSIAKIEEQQEFTLLFVLRNTGAFQTNREKDSSLFYLQGRMTLTGIGPPVGKSDRPCGPSGGRARVAAKLVGGVRPDFTLTRL
jgi:hypothetical protein